jgi:hypothetical protein
MIKQLGLHQIGPVHDLEVEFGERLNLVTGDNGLGKTFLLDACWYALTRTWADAKQFYPAPDIPKNEPPYLDYKLFDKEGNEVPGQANYNFATQTWRMPQTHLRTPGLVIYVRVDGGFSVWDPFRNYWLDELEQIGENERGASSSLSSWVAQRPMAFQFSNTQVWEGLEDEMEGQKFTFCNGFLRDVETWRLRGNGPFQLLQNVLETLSSGEEETLSLGEGVRVRVGDLKDIPTLRMAYGPVPVTQAAAGMRRVLALAYLLVWAWDEHVRAAQILRNDPTNRIVLLFDEVEAQLHPKWQRVFLPSIMKVVDGLLVKGRVEAITKDPSKSLDEKVDPLLKTIPRSVQIIATTHAPLVLASVEAAWDGQKDSLFDFNLVEGKRVVFEEIDFARQGSAANWLTSGSFDLQSSYAVAAEKAMGRADPLMRQYPHAEEAQRREVEEVHNALKEALGGDDEYWPYWLPYYEATRKGR